ncbi:hypothetical protein AVEN_21187-1 [Araneus ventricosus]|uniref:Reverse transcriptase domain-containing protein n=1 Tax=Araneus ventricosus TaxID=182803 RepID=A0A4Y2P2Y5_ARAVE|nr:hypothetical protein AVEN_21187-1 [Araneus ventricosus]
MDNFFPSPSSEDNLDYTPIIGHVEPMVLEDIEMVINALKGGKAPGLDPIDFRMWRAVFIHDKEFILDLINICFKFNCFPEHLRNAKVFFLLKDGKDPGLCTSYRPVCLLPTLGKRGSFFYNSINGLIETISYITINTAFEKAKAVIWPFMI